MTANSTKAQRAFEMDAWFKAPGDSRLAIESDLFDFARRLLADAVEYTLYEGESNEAEAFGVENLVEFLLLLRMSAWFLSAPQGRCACGSTPRWVWVAPTPAVAARARASLGIPSVPLGARALPARTPRWSRGLLSHGLGLASPKTRPGTSG